MYHSRKFHLNYRFLCLFHYFLIYFIKLNKNFLVQVICKKYFFNKMLKDSQVESASLTALYSEFNHNKVYPHITVSSNYRSFNCFVNLFVKSKKIKYTCTKRKEHFT